MQGASRETHIPTEQFGAQTSPRLPRAHGDEKRSENPEPAPGQGPQTPVGVDRAAITALKARRDFLRLGRSVKVHTPFFTLQGRPADNDGGRVRVGFTVTKKVGAAVVRNRLKRRLRALARDVLPVAGAPGWSYVLFGRHDGLARPYARLVDDLTQALHALHRKARRRPQTSETRRAP